MPDIYMMIFIVLSIVAITVFVNKKITKTGLSFSEYLSLPEYKIVRKYEFIIVGVLLLVGIFVRMYMLGSLPGGINQDEASISYDTFAIANYGIDRNGYFFPVYPVAWGAGHAPLMTYISMPFVKLFGLNAFSFRLANCILCILSLLFIYLLVKRMHNTETGMLALLLLVVCPWHIMMSRWALDANCLPAVFLCGVWILTCAIDKKSSKLFYLAAVVFGISLYAYGTVYIVMPIFLLIVAIYLIIHKRIKLKTFILSSVLFLAVAAPIIIFLVINFFDFDSIVTPFFSIPRLTALRSDSTIIKFDANFFSAVQSNIPYTIKTLFFQATDYTWNSIKEFGTVYLYAPPLMILGLILLFAQNLRKGFHLSITMFAWFIGALMLSLVLYGNINRINIIFIPIIYLMVLAICFIVRNIKYALPVIILIIVLNFGFFATYYFTKYPEQINPQFYETFGDAIKDAETRTTGSIYVLARVNGAYAETLFYSQPSPYEFTSTVEYYDVNAEFRQVRKFGRFYFYAPANIDDASVYVIDSGDIGFYSSRNFKIAGFENYSVAYK